MEKKEELYRIGEMAEYFGVSTDTLRIYDRKSLIPTSRDPGNRYRVYNREDLIFLDYIMRLRKLDMSLRDVREQVNGGSLEEALKNMRRQRDRLEETLTGVQNKLALADDYIASFSDTLESMGQYAVEVSPPMLLINVDRDMTGAMSAFTRLTQTNVPKLTFLIPQELAYLPPHSRTTEYFNRVKPQFSNALTLIDDGDFRTLDHYSDSVFTYYEPRKCLRTAIRTVTNQDYSEFFRCLGYLREHELEPDGDLILRTVSFRYHDAAYYDLWIPIR